MLRNVVAALIETELEELRRSRTPPLVVQASAGEIADDVLRYLNTIPAALRDGIELALDSLEIAIPPFTMMPLAKRVDFMRKGAWAGLAWESLSYALSVCWIVLYSRPEIRAAVGSAVVPSPANAQPDDRVDGVDVNARLGDAYDVCVVGSGAGGALAAYRLGAAGKKVLLIDSGRWIPPQQLGTRLDVALSTLYKTGGVQPALPTLGAIFGNRAAGVNFLQANVFGGGPYVNNAIQLPIDPDRYKNVWQARGFPLAWSELKAAMTAVAADLQFDARLLDPALVGDSRTAAAQGVRSKALIAAASALWTGLGVNPVSLWQCVGCGGCNIGCRYNCKSGGPHGMRDAGAPRSYLMRAILETSGNVKLRAQVKALRFHINSAGRADSLTVRDLVSGQLGSVRAKAFVLAAGPVASSRVLQETHVALRTSGPAFGARVAANVTTPVSARMPQDFATAGPSPGTQMCFFVSPENGLLLEGWFDYPAGVSAGSCGLPQDAAALGGNYGKTNIMGVVVPIDDLAAVHPPPVEISAEIKDADYTRLLRAVAHAARSLYQSGAESVVPGHRLNTNKSGPLVIDKGAAAAGDVDAIVAALRARLSGPQDLSLQTPHPQGGNAMAASPDDGAVGPEFKVFGTSNLFVSDASLFPAGCGRNPQFTVLGLAQLASQSVLAAMDGGGLDRVQA